jgi:hypothetical protein
MRCWLNPGIWLPGYYPHPAHANPIQMNGIKHLIFNNLSKSIRMQRIWADLRWNILGDGPGNSGNNRKPHWQGLLGDAPSSETFSKPSGALVRLF